MNIRVSIFQEKAKAPKYQANALVQPRKLELTTGRPEPGNGGYSRDWQLGYQVPDSREGGKFEF